MSLLGHLLNALHQAIPTIIKGQITEQSTQTPFNLEASVQPSTSAQLSMLPETRRLRGGIYTLITFETLLTVDNDVYPDLILFDNKTYEVVTKLKWENNILNHNIYLIQEIRTR